MNIYTLDFETYFDDTYTLKKMTTEAYIRDPRFEALLLGVREPDGNTFWLNQEQIAPWLASVDWSQNAILAHHAHFDGLILSHHYGVTPKYWFDTLCMAKLMIGNHLSVALSALAKHYELGSKSVQYDDFKGRSWVNLLIELRRELGEGCIRDVKLTWEIFQRLAADFPAAEYGVIDMTVRMFTEPKLVGDADEFERIKIDEWIRKSEALIRLGVTEADVQSSSRFANLLYMEDFELETKESENGPVPAVSASDQFMRSLLTHEHLRVRLLAEARLDAKSTIEETSAGRLASMARRGRIAVYLNYCGAHTTRWSDGDKVNFQNFRRGGDVRKALSAPKGYMLAVCDLSQIECRILNYCARQTDVVEAFADKRDVYAEGATKFFGFPINKKDHSEKRRLFKAVELACGYGMGGAKFAAFCAVQDPPLHLEDGQETDLIKSYRTTHSRVTAYWHEGDQMLDFIANGVGQMQWGPLIVERGKIILPNGTPILYELQKNRVQGGWERRTRNSWSPIWGGTLVENVVHAMARVVMSEAMMRIRNRSYSIALITHDEVVCIVPEHQAEQHYALIEAEMKQTPIWLPGIPLYTQGGVSERYEK